MTKRRKGPPARPSAARDETDKAGVISETPPAEAHTAPDGQPDATAIPATQDHAPSVHETLMETVSPEAIEAGTGEAVSPQAAAADEPPQPEGEPAELAHDAADEPASETAMAEDAPSAVMEPPEALETAPDGPASDIAPLAPIAAAVAPQAAATLEAATALTTVPETVARSSRTSLDMIGEIAEANATLLAFLRNEGSAAVAHWQSLSGAKTPADALRIQVDEMQRVADASLTCFTALARRAGRLAAGIGRP